MHEVEQASRHQGARRQDVTAHGQVPDLSVTVTLFITAKKHESVSLSGPVVFEKEYDLQDCRSVGMALPQKIERLEGALSLFPRGAR